MDSLEQKWVGESTRFIFSQVLLVEKVREYPRLKKFINTQLFSRFTSCDNYLKDVSEYDDKTKQLRLKGPYASLYEPCLFMNLPAA